MFLYVEVVMRYPKFEKLFNECYGLLIFVSKDFDLKTIKDYAVLSPKVPISLIVSFLISSYCNLKIIKAIFELTQFIKANKLY